MMEIPKFWHDAAPMSVKCERANSLSNEGHPDIFQYCEGSNLNFSTAVSTEEDDFQCSRKRGHQMSRDPMSHRVIEKRRRDRMNNCLADLSRLIPADYLKKGRGRIEKTEIIEMAIKHMKYLQTQAGKINSLAECTSTGHSPSNAEDTSPGGRSTSTQPHRTSGSLDNFRSGYQECVAETMHFLVEIEGFFAEDQMCLELVNHLQRHCEKIVTAGIRQQAEAAPKPTASLYDQTQQNAENSSSSSPNSSDTTKDNSSSQSDQKDVKPFEKKRNPGPCQLRKMLTCPTISLHNDDYHPVGASDPILYKFKNTIKQRFTEEHDDSLKRRRLFEIPEIKRRYSDSCSIASSLNSPELFTSSSSSPKPSSYGIPIFALHANGSFYIPITIDSELLAPFLKELNKAAEENQSYHPVTISVSFPQSLRVLRPYVKDLLLLKNVQSSNRKMFERSCV